MELKLLKESVGMGQRVFRGAAEQPIESDLFLPDYYESVARILKCSAVCGVSRQSVMGDRLSIEGQIFITILYAPESMCLPRTVSTVLPYTKIIELKPDIEANACEVAPKLDYLNCRLLSSRRLDIKGAFSLQYDLFGGKQAEVVVGSECDTLQLRGGKRKLFTQGPTERKQFSIREELDSDGMDDCTSIVTTRCCGEITDCRMVTGKVVVKGAVRLKVYFEREDGTMGCGDFELPASQIMDTGAGENDKLTVAMNVINCDVTRDDSEEFPVLKAEITVEFLLSIICEEEMTLSDDAYDLKQEIEVTKTPLRCAELISVEDEIIRLKTKAPMPERMKDILFTISEVQGVTTEREGSRMNFRIPVKHTVVYCDETGELLQFERMEDGGWSTEVGESGEVMGRPMNASVLSESCSPDGAGGIDIKAEIRLTCAVMKEQETAAIGDITATGDDKPQTGGGALIIYYPDANESLWDVAKRFSSTREAIRAENELEGDRCGAGTMLMIPSLQ